MKKFLFKSAILALAAPVLLASCSSDSNEPNIPTPEPQNFEGIMLSLPDLEGTRSDASSDEYAVKDLRVIVYKVEGGNATLAFNEVLSGNDVSGINNSSYKDIPVVLGAGSYRMYLVANVEDYSITKTISSDELAEADLQAAKITDLGAIYESELSGTSRKYLPMACQHKDIKKGEADDADKYGNDLIVVAPKKATSVYADLTFAVAKVRCTVMNSATQAVQLESLSLNPYTSTTGLINGKGDNTVVATDLKLTDKFYELTAPTETGGSYTLSSTVLTDPKSSLWGWRNTFYIAENLFDVTDDDDAKTTLNFDFNSNSYDRKRVIGQKYDSDGEAASATGVVRGHFYDIEGTITPKELTLQVRVKEWGYHKSVIDLQDL